MHCENSQLYDTVVCFKYLYKYIYFKRAIYRKYDAIFQTRITFFLVSDKPSEDIAEKTCDF